MATTKINVTAVINAGTTINNAKKTVGNVKSSYNSTRKNIDGAILNRNNLRNNFSNISTRIANLETYISNIKSTVENGANKYYNTDVRIIREFNSKNNGLKTSSGKTSTAMFGNAAAFITDVKKIDKKKSSDSQNSTSTSTTKKKDEKKNMLPEAGFGEGGGGFRDSATEDNETKSILHQFIDGELKGDKKSWLFNKMDGFTNEDGTTTGFASGSVGAVVVEGAIKPNFNYEDDSAIYKKKQKDKTPEKLKKYQKNADEDWYDKKGTVFEVEEEVSAEASLLKGEASIEGTAGSASVEAAVLTAEAHASAAAGLYVYDKDKDGNVVKMFSPGVSAEVGASVAVAKAEAEGRVGFGENNNMLGLYGEGEVSALAAEAEAKFGLNKKEAHVKLNAEANLVEAKGSAGVSVLGTDVGVSGSVKVGVGAHADVGYTDGKFKVDIGVAVGVGVSVGFEVDFGGTVSAVTDLASSAWDFFF